MARGYRRLWRAIFTFILGTDLSRALSLVSDAEQDLTESQVRYRMSLACCLRAFVLWGFGDVARSEEAARRGLAIARDIERRLPDDPEHLVPGPGSLRAARSRRSSPRPRPAPRR